MARKASAAAVVIKGVGSEKIVGECSRVLRAKNGNCNSCGVLWYKGREEEARSEARDSDGDGGGGVNADKR